MNQQQNDPVAPAGSPGSDGERQLRREPDTAERAGCDHGEQVHHRLDARMREFVARQEMFFLSTADAKGACDGSFRAGPPGFLLVLDERTLAYPEYQDDGVTAALGNIRENPHVGILMIDFSGDRTGLHVNGRARLLSDELMRILRPDLPEVPAPGRRPQIWVEVDVEEAHAHRSEHIPHLVRPPVRDDTGDVCREGGDFFDSADRGELLRDGVASGDPAGPAPHRAEPPSRPGTPLPAGWLPVDVGERARLAVRSRADRAGLPNPEMWRREAERALARAIGGDQAPYGTPPAPAVGVAEVFRAAGEGVEVFRGWFG